MYSFDKPEFSVNELKDFKLEPSTRLIQSLRGFACNASMLIAGYHHYVSTEYLHQNPDFAKNLSGAEYALSYYKYHAFQSDILVRLRKACEPDKNSLAAGAISHLLKDKKNVEQLRNYIAKDNEIIDSTFNSYIVYIQKHCSELIIPNSKINEKSAPLSQKIALIRRMTNKAIAHITFDDYKVASDDLHDVFIAVSTIACAIQIIMGKLACPSELYTVEKMACEIAYQEIPLYKKEYIPIILNFLPIWVEHNNASIIINNP